MYKKIILPVSGMRRGERGLKALTKALGVCSGEIILLHVTEPIPQVVGGDARKEMLEERKSQAVALLKPVFDKLESEGTPFHMRIEEGTPAESIIRVTDEENADLIVMFTDGRDGFTDMLLGSITERVLRHTAVDLLAVRS